MQGRFDRPDYREGMNVCLNTIPTEEGPATRRSGTRLGGSTRNGAYAVLREYHVNQAQPFDIELTEGHLRLWQADAGLVTHAATAVSAISSASPAVFTSVAHGLVTDDQVLFTLESATSYAGIAQVLGRQLSVTKLTNDTFTAVDALTAAAIDGTLITFGALTTLKVALIFDYSTPYLEADLQQVRIIQDSINVLLLHPDYPPQALQLVTS